MEEQKNNLFKYFEQICKIPRQSGDEEAISAYLMEFAKERGLEVQRDSFHNVLIRKPSTIPEYQGPAVILQGHMDMVYEKSADSTHRYEDGIGVMRQGDYFMSAHKTSLGADNGAAVAYALDLLDQDQIPLPALEVLITAGEEVGLEGVKNLELTDLKGNYLINLDAEEEGVFFTSCAGGVRTELSLPLEYEMREEELRIELTLNGISGGHSGLEIGMGKANAVKVLGRILSYTEGLARAAHVESQGKANAIASRGTLLFYTSKAEWEQLAGRLSELEKQLREEYAGTDQISFSIRKEEGECRNASVFTEKTRLSLLRILTFLPCGVIRRMPGKLEMVQTSSNIGALYEQDGKLIVLSSSRSSVGSEKQELKDRMRMLAEAFGAGCRFYGEYPQWEYRRESRLRDICRKVYSQYSGREPVFTGIHAGIECGYLAEKLGGEIDMISFGATLLDVHTPQEKMNAGSFYRTEEILIEILKEISIL